MVTVNLGNIRFNWCGAYDSASSYEKDDVVGYKGSSFIAKQELIGITPTQGTDWDLMVAGVEQPVAIGDHRLMLFRAPDLPFGWYVRNGDNFLLTSPQGVAINSLSDMYKSDHGIITKTIGEQQYINIPTAFHSDGRGFFERAVNGNIRQVGSIENDAIRNIVGGYFGTANSVNPTCAAYKIGTSNYTALNQYTGYYSGFDASLIVPTAQENRPLNIGMTPVIYLGV